MAKGEGSRGGSIIGHTARGRAIYSASGEGRHDAYAKHAVLGKTHKQTARGLHNAFSDYSAADHADAAAAHMKIAIPDTDSSGLGVIKDDDAYRAARGHLEATSLDKPKKNESLVDWKTRTDRKSDTPDFQKSLFDTAELMQQMLIQQAQDQASMVPARVDALNPGGDGGVPTQVEQARANLMDAQVQALPFRVDVLAPTPYSTLETLAMVKSIASLPAAQHPSELARAGLSVVGPRRVHLHKSHMSLVEFADAVGTTEDTVRRLAKRCGDPEHFVSMIKDKMPDIQRAHSLSEDDATALFDAAVRTVKSLGTQAWDQWCSKSFGTTQVSDRGIADAIAVNGFMHRNQCTSDGFAVMGGPVHKEPRKDLPSPEPIARPVDARPLIGGNLSIGVRHTDVGPYAFRS